MKSRALSVGLEPYQVLAISFYLHLLIPLLKPRLSTTAAIRLLARAA